MREIPPWLHELGLDEYADLFAAIAEYEGFIARYMGDGVLAYFGYPKSHEEDPERAVLAGLSLLDSIRELNQDSANRSGAELSVRIGIATGLVVVGDLIGEGASRESPVIEETPDIAARLQNLADPNTIVIAESTHRLTGRAFEYRELGARKLKGVNEKNTSVASHSTKLCGKSLSRSAKYWTDADRRSRRRGRRAPQPLGTRQAGRWAGRPALREKPASESHV